MELLHPLPDLRRGGDLVAPQMPKGKELKRTVRERGFNAQVRTNVSQESFTFLSPEMPLE
jgi:hypothetical protein